MDSLTVSMAFCTTRHPYMWSERRSTWPRIFVASFSRCAFVPNSKHFCNFCFDNQKESPTCMT